MAGIAEVAVGPPDDPAGPLKGGTTADQTSVDRIRDAINTETGDRSVFIIVAKGAGPDESLVEALPDDGRSTVAVFTSRAAAELYLQVAHWEKNREPRALSAASIKSWLESLKEGGVETVTVNASRHDQTRGLPQHALQVSDLVERAGEDLLLMFQELQTSNSPARSEGGRGARGG